MNSQHVLRFEGITKTFPGVVALDQVSFEVDAGTVHAIVGENGAGKSTLMKILGGAHVPDAGVLHLNEEPVRFADPLESISSGISIVYQELNLVSGLTVAANMFLGKEGSIILDDRQAELEASKVLDELGIPVGAESKIRDLSIGQQQLVEVAKAVSTQPRILVMDEPTSSLSDKEIRILFDIVRKLRDRGTTIIYISHKLEEIFELSDRVTVLRDGRHVISDETSRFSSGSLIKHMVARDLSEFFPTRTPHIGQEVLRVERISRYPVVRESSFTLHEGEVIGFAGLMGAGRTELMRLIFGVDQKDSGEIWINETHFRTMTPQIALRNGVGFVTEDRRKNGLVMCRSLRENTTLPNLDDVCGLFGVVNSRRENDAVSRQMDRLSIKAASSAQLVRYLSGGNQQKVILGKWLLANTRILIMDEPTRGIDVGSKREIYTLINEISGQGIAIILISSELEEVMALSDRILVMHDGGIVAEIPRDEAKPEVIMELAFGRQTV
ncbi:MAG: sugar ABC transporter ATP-binding protein [Balneolaceae bacterium]